MTVTTLRLPDDLDARLTAYCQEVGAVKNRVAILALRSYLDDGEAPALPVERRYEPDGEAALLEADELAVPRTKPHSAKRAAYNLSRCTSL